MNQLPSISGNPGLRKFFSSRWRKWLAGGCFLFLTQAAAAQETFPVNGVADNREGVYAFINATIVKDSRAKPEKATLVVREGRIVAAGPGVAVPKDAVVIDCNGKYIYPSFIDIYSDYGIQAAQRAPGGGFGGPAQLSSNAKGAYGWNQAIHSDVDAARIFAQDESKARQYRDIGFGTVLTHQKDGIARGTGVVVTLAAKKENLVILKEKASAHYSFSKGSSTQSYPGSLMGTIALLRQSYLDAAWYRNNPKAEGVNLTLKSWNEIQQVPQIFEANDKWNNLRADKIGDEFGVQYIIKGGGNEYQRIKEMAATKATFILPLEFPQTMDVEDPAEARFVSLQDMKHWEMAPSNPAAFEKAGIPFCLTPSDMRDMKQFMAELRKALKYGLSETTAMDALTKTPATLLGVYEQVGSLDAGKLANFLITSGPVFDEKTIVYQNWIQGEKYGVKESGWENVAGTYTVKLTTGKEYTLDVKSVSAASLLARDTVNAKFSHDGKTIKFSFGENKRAAILRFSGVDNKGVWQGTGTDTLGNSFLWSAIKVKDAVVKTDKPRTEKTPESGKLTYPLNGYGWEEMPKAEDLLFKNATVWTNEAEGKIEGADVLVRNGKIAQVGKNISAGGAKVIDATGKHLTAGIIDEHSHIAVASINEGGQSVTSEVRIADNINPDDINIYRQLSGGVTSSHILHGSANTIGGQTQLLKLRWGANAEEMKFAGADGFIKFALGENVKRSSSQANIRFPDTRMGVEQVLTDAFQRAADYQNALKKISADAKGKKGVGMPNPWSIVRRDLELDALVEIMNSKRFITCHSYVQSEIVAAMRVAEKFGFKFNTFTHILEGYKVADKMKAHGANTSTFSDWWQYKMEVVDAIPYNASIMQRVGLNVAINSDDAEMARRLNQEAAKSVKYGDMSEEDALKMVTLNPAKMMHVDKQVGSIKAGKDADLVLWSDNPLSIYAKAEQTIVDGIVYFDRERDAVLRTQIKAERNRLINKMLGEKKNGAPVRPAEPSMQLMHSCSDHDHSHGLLIIDVE